MHRAFKIVTGIVGLAFVTSCTVKDVDIPALAGPSTLSYSILLTASTDTLTQDGVSSATIDITARDGNGQLLTGRPLRAAILVGGVVQDFGTLNTKTPVTGGTLRYTAPPASPLPSGQVAQVVTVAVTPTDSGDFRNDFARGVDIRLVPQGVILPTNPDLTPAFTVTPASPQAFSTASFDASTTTNGGTACLNACSYSWNFGDGTSGTGINTTHDYRTVGTYVVTLSVTDSRGAQATLGRAVVVQSSTPPTPAFTFSPTPAFVNQDIFFNAETSRAAAGRTIVSYGWNLGDGRTASGYTIARSYSSVGVFTVTLRVTDDAGATATTSQTVSVTSPQPVARFTFTPTAPTSGSTVVFDATSSSGPSAITTYAWTFAGSGVTPSSGGGSTISVTYTGAGTRTVTLTVTDSQGRTATTTQSITIS